MKALKFIVGFFFIFLLASGISNAQPERKTCWTDSGTNFIPCLSTTESFSYTEEVCLTEYTGIFGNHWRQRGHMRTDAILTGMESGDTYIFNYSGSMNGNHGMGKDDNVQTWSSGGIITIRKPNGGVVYKRKTRFHFTTNANGEPTSDINIFEEFCKSE